jgi:hypothetical protein
MRWGLNRDPTRRLPIQCLADVGVSVPGAGGCISGHARGDDAAAEASVDLEIGLAGDPGWRMATGLLDRPWVILIVLTPQRDEKRGINDDGISHNPSFSGIPFS